MELHFPLAHQNCLLDYKGFEIPSSLGKGLSAGLWAPLCLKLLFSHIAYKRLTVQGMFQALLQALINNV